MDALSLLLLPAARPARPALHLRDAAAAAAAARVPPPRLPWSRAVARRLLSTSVAAVAAETPRAEDAPSASGKEERFDWLDQWYPVAPVCDLDPGAPHGKTVLGLRIVAWFDRTTAAADGGGGEWRVFDDSCPHRLAPLSEGRVASVAVVGFLAVAKGTVVTSVVQRSAVVAAAVLCFAASRWLANFIEKNFYFQDYVHAYNAMAPVSLPLLSRARPPLLLRDAGVKLSTVRLPPPWRQQWKHTSGERRRRLSMPASAVAAETPPPHARAEEEEEAAPAVGGGEEGRFEWLDQWYPVAPVCDLDPRKPHGKMVMGLRVVAWFDGGGGEWRVVDDACPHRLAPLSEGRVDGKGRLQCAYHGWCFDGHGSCQFIPQAPALGPPVHKNSKACVASYPSVVQNNILWFYPRTEPEYRDVLQRKRPPYFPDLDDPSFNTVFGVRDFPYGYRNAQAILLRNGHIGMQLDILCRGSIAMQNLMDPAHVPYAHKGLVPQFQDKEDPGRYNIHLLSTVEFDQERGGPVKMKIEEANIDGFLSIQGENWGHFRFIAPCTINRSELPFETLAHFDQEKQQQQPQGMLVFLCIPVAPGRSRVIWAFPQSVSAWPDKFIPRWLHHMVSNTVLDSDLYLLHIEERNFAAVGVDKWQKACYVPTSSDNMIITFRNWFRKYCKHQVGWATPMVNQLPTTPTKDQLMERYWSHVMQCTSCSAALKWMRAMEVALQVASVAVVGFLAAGKGTTVVTSAVQRAAVVAAAALCFAASRWLANFIEKSFYFQDYVHAYNAMAPVSLPLLSRARPPLLLRDAGVKLSTVRLPPPWRQQWKHTSGERRRRLSMPASAVAAETPPPHARAEEEEEAAPAVGGGEEGRFEWLDQWYPVAPVCDLDPRKPHGKMVMGLRVVAWFDGGGGEWRVVDDACPHRLAPLSEGRVDGKGRLQCAYHGWCFDGHGSCQFIPQAPALGPPCSTVHLLSTVESDQEGGYPVKIRTEQAKIDGFLSVQEDDVCYMKFDAPCTLYGKPFRTKEPQIDQGKEKKKKKQPVAMTVFLCVPVAPGRSRLIWAFPRNVDAWLDNIIPRWLYHIVTNIVLDSDSYLLHIEERNFGTVGLDNWHKACYVPTSSDNMVITFRNWFRKYCKHQIGWATPMANQLPPTPTKDQVLERYRSHVMQCTSCSAALKKMKALEVALQVASVAIVGFLAVAKGSLAPSVVRRAAAVSTAVLCFAASRWLASFIEKSFYFQDYVHAYNTPRIPPWRRQWISPTDARRRRLSMPVSAVAAEAPLPRAVDEKETPAAGEERFDWLDQWYPVAPVRDLDKRKPHGKMVMGLRVVAWFDGGGGEWRVVDDACPHRLAPLSEGRVDGKGRLQCAYHGWCFDGHGSCQFIPQAPALGPPVHKNSKACVASYPSVVQNNILWFYPRSEPEYKEILQRKRPPYIRELDDPSSVINSGVRDLLYGYRNYLQAIHKQLDASIYELLVENFMDPAHVPYAHRGQFPHVPREEDIGRYVPHHLR
uniref:Rieske domain-containing protein n=1 Tax=Oryza nivara TaxID=4536 RepID=A0A0E0GV81_ORYNI